jgi:hypothetical protein
VREVRVAVESALVSAFDGSGFAPRCQHDRAVQILAHIESLRDIQVIPHKVFPECAGIDALLNPYGPMALIAESSLGLASWLFRHRMY